MINSSIETSPEDKFQMFKIDDREVARDSRFFCSDANMQIQMQMYE